MRALVYLTLLVPLAVGAQEPPASEPEVDEAEAPAVPPPPPEALVRVESPKAAVDLDATPRELRLTAVLHSELPAAARAVELGVLFSADEGLLATLDAGRAYAHVGEGGGGVVASGGAVAMRRWSTVAVPAGGQAQVELLLSLPDGAPDPLAFELHVLSYELAQIEAPLLRTLLATRAAADEAAVLRAFGLGAGSAAMRAAGERLAGVLEEALLRAVADEALAAIPARPTQDETLMRVAWVLILGALGGDAVTGALGTLALRPELEAFDEALQVVRAAALVGSPLEAPLGHALPRQARKMAEVVAAARLGPEGLEVAGPRLAADPAPAAQEPLPADLGGPDDELEVLEPQPEANESAWVLLLLVAALVAGWWMTRRLRTESK